MTARRSGRIAARRASLLFAAAGTVSIANAWIPGVCPPAQRGAFTLLGLLDIAAATLLVLLPWRRWPFGALAAVPVTALVLVDAFAIVGGLAPWVYSFFFVVLAVWVGASLPRWSTTALAPAVAAAYVLPQLLSGHRVDALATVGLVVPLVVVIGELVGHIVGDLRSANLRLAAASLRDELTGLGNRRYAIETLDTLRRGDAVLILDVDHFKRVNDTYGHATGDAVLAALGAFLRERVRGADAIARLGGDECLVVLRQAGGGAVRTAERILDDWRATDVPASLSIGIAVFDGAEFPADALARADGALYGAKNAGRDRVRMASGVNGYSIAGAHA